MKKQQRSHATRRNYLTGAVVPLLCGVSLSLSLSPSLSLSLSSSLSLSLSFLSSLQRNISSSGWSVHQVSVRWDQCVISDWQMFEREERVWVYTIASLCYLKSTPTGSQAPPPAGSHRSQVAACRGERLQMDVRGRLSISPLALWDKSTRQRGGGRKLPAFYLPLAVLFLAALFTAKESVIVSSFMTINKKLSFGPFFPFPIPVSRFVWKIFVI